MQKRLQECGRAFLDQIFEALCLKPEFYVLMMDNFGNYLCQKIIECTNDSQIKTLLRTLLPHMSVICLNNHGTRAVQSVIERISGSSDLIDEFLRSITGNLYEVILDVHGNHVIQNCVVQFPAVKNQIFFDIIAENCLEVA